MTDVTAHTHFFSFVGSRKMPVNNNPKSGQSAAARLAQLPVVQSACVKLLVMYTGTKGSHPKLRSVCEVLESSVTALLSPVIVKLEPHLSIPNDIACKGLDWVETRFPVVHAPTEQIVATATGKMHEIQALQSAPQPDGSLVERAVSVRSKGLDLALNLKETLVDGKHSISNDDKEKDAALKQVEGFEMTTPPDYHAHLVSVAGKTYKRTPRHRVGSNTHPDQVAAHLSGSPVVIQEVQTSWQTLALSVQGLPKYIQNQLGCLQVFLIQMYYLFSPPYQNYHHSEENLQDSTEASAHKNVVQLTPVSYHIRRPIRGPLIDNCNVKGCVDR
ncbi:perilipin-2-like isoform X2 [Nelusetta ayraudi]|uniref:perilipin-2-like isoform X2 n=1 Tax=Nelusetta ayraudi TaxID=303726 RepID=UPI003F721BCD